MCLGENKTKKFMDAAIEEAKASGDRCGIPIGAVLVLDGKIIGRGHNQRVFKGSVILHAEMDCLENVGRLKAGDYKRAILYTTLSPCWMCSGAILLYGIKHVVIGENSTFVGPESKLLDKGVKLYVQNDRRCKNLMKKFIKKYPKLWNEDIGR